MIDLKEFISETLTQILEGVSEAQEAANGQLVNAETADPIKGGNIQYTLRHGVFTIVDFDVAVTAESNAGGKASVKVFGIGGHGEGGVRNQTASRVVFSVPVRLPDGDSERANEVRTKRRNLVEGAIGAQGSGF